MNICGTEGKKWRDFQPAMFDLSYKSRTAVSILFQPQWREEEGMGTSATLGPAGVLGHLLTLVSYSTTSSQSRILWHSQMQQL